MNMKKIGVLLVLVIIIPISFAQPGLLKINNIDIPYSTSSFDDILDELEDSFGESEILYVYANGQRIAKESNKGIFYFHNDHLGSPAVVTDAVGKVIEMIDYMPFGAELLNSNSKIKYNSKELDSDTVLLYYGTRYYDSSIGRFITADAIENVDLLDPQSLNRYVYVQNNPLKYRDDKGEWIWNAVIGAGFGAALEIGSQTLLEGKSLSEIEWGRVAVSAGAGGVAAMTGAGIGSLATKTAQIGSAIGKITAGVTFGAMSGGVSGAITQAGTNIAQGKDITEGIGTATAEGAAIGAVFGGAAGAKVESVTKQIISQKQSAVTIARKPITKIDLEKGKKIMEKMERMSSPKTTTPRRPGSTQQKELHHGIYTTPDDIFRRKGGTVYYYNERTGASG